jgi:hypothetical protein
VLHIRLRVHWPVTSTGRGPDDIENTASSVVACWTVFTELLAGNTLIKSVTISTNINETSKYKNVNKNLFNSSRVVTRTDVDTDRHAGGNGDMVAMLRRESGNIGSFYHIKQV